MNLALKGDQGAGQGVALVDRAEDLGAFLELGSAALIWRRPTPPNIQMWLDDLNPDAMPKGRVTLPVYAVPQTVTALCDMAGTPAGLERTWLEDDISVLATAFADLVNARFLRLRLDLITTNACRRFHVDAIHSRLICTYRGTGTQYGHSRRGEDPSRVFTAAVGAPMLLRGSLWPPQPDNGFVHRSPPIEGTGETRLVLVLDPVTDLMED